LKQKDEKLEVCRDGDVMNWPAPHAVHEGTWRTQALGPVPTPSDRTLN